MGKTKELYYESAYLKEFDAEVISCERIEDKSGKVSFAVELDATAFFPEQGGQTSDIGEFFADGSKVTVLHTAIDKEGRITHICDKELAVGTRIHGAIDWSHRFSNMQQHTGEHIFSGLVNSMFGYDNVGFHLSDSEVTMDYNGVLTADDIETLEKKVNQAIWKNLPVKCEFPTEEELKNINYRSKKELSGDVRIVTIDGYDCCACCAPHVERTAEIGFLKVVSLQNYKGGVRVNILCGKRALEYVSMQQSIVSELTGLMTTSADKIADGVKRAFDENAKLKAELSSLNEKLMEYEIAEIPADQVNVFVVKGSDFDMNVCRKLVNMLARDHAGYCGAFAGDAKAGYRYIIAAGSNGWDSRNLSEILKKEYGAKGGGQPAMVQGSIPAGDFDIEEVVKRLSEETN